MKKSLGMHIYVTGVNHSSAPIEIRERLAVSGDHLPEALGLLANFIKQGLILSTCNRVEVYSVSNGEASQQAVDFLKAHANVSGAELLP